MHGFSGDRACYLHHGTTAPWSTSAHALVIKPQAYDSIAQTEYSCGAGQECLI